MRSRSGLFSGYVSSRQRYESEASPPQVNGHQQPSAQPTLGKAAACAKPAPVNPIPDSHRDAGAGEAHPFLTLVETINRAHSLLAQFTEAEQLALLIARGSDFAKLCAYAMKANGVVATTETYKALVTAGLAIPAGKFHNLTPRGRWIANIVARELAPTLGIEVQTTYVSRGRGMYERGIKSKFNFW